MIKNNGANVTTVRNAVVGCYACNTVAINAYAIMEKVYVKYKCFFIPILSIEIYPNCEAIISQYFSKINYDVRSVD